MATPKTVTLPLYAYRPSIGGHPVNDRVSANDATALWLEQGVDWPVSGDDTRVGFGRYGMRAVTGALWPAS